MIDPVSAVLSVGTIVSLAFQGFLNSEAGKASVGKVAEKVTEVTLEKMGQLRRLIMGRLRGKSPELEQIAATVEQQQPLTPEQVEAVKAYLHVEMGDDQQFAAEVKKLAEEITLMQIDDSSTMTQINYGGTNYQIKTAPNNTNFFGGTHHHTQK